MTGYLYIIVFCIKKMHAGSSTRTKKGGHVHTYPFVESDPLGPRRTHSSFVEIANGSITNTHVRR